MRRTRISICIPALLAAILLAGCGSRQGSDYTAAPPPSATASAPPQVAMAGGARGFNVKPLALKPPGFGKKR